MRIIMVWQPVHILLLAMLSWSHLTDDVRDLATAVANSCYTVNLLMLLMKLYSDAPRPMIDTFYSHSYMIVLPLHTVSEKGRTIRCCSTKLASNMMTFSLDTRLTALFPGISGFY